MRPTLGSVLPVMAAACIFAVACPGGTLDISKHRETMESLRTLAAALEDYKVQHGQYPISEEVPIATLAANLASPSVGSLPTHDAWRNEILYMSYGESYVAWSRGKDGNTDRVHTGGPIAKFEADVIIADGVFWQHLEGLEALRSLPDESPIEDIRKTLASGNVDAS